MKFLVNLRGKTPTCAWVMGRGRWGRAIRCMRRATVFTLPDRIPYCDEHARQIMKGNLGVKMFQVTEIE